MMAYKVVTSDVLWRTLRENVCAPPSVFSDKDSAFYLEKCFLEIQRYGGNYTYLTSQGSPSVPLAALGSYVCAEMLIINFVFVKPGILADTSSVIRVLLSSLLIRLAKESHNHFDIAELSYPMGEDLRSQHNTFLEFCFECFDDREYPPMTKYRFTRGDLELLISRST